MKLTLTTSIAALALATTGAMADDHNANMRMNMQNNMSDTAMDTDEMHENAASLIRSRDITGGAIYTTNADSGMWDSDTMYDGMDNDWTQIGEIEDIVLAEDGKVTGIVAEVGGFLDIGDKHVMISVKDLNLVAVDDVSYAYVTRYSEDQLEEMQAVDEGFWN